MKFRLIIDNTASVYVTTQAIKRGIGDRTSLNLAVQETYATIKRLKCMGISEKRRGYSIHLTKV